MPSSPQRPTSPAEAFFLLPHGSLAAGDLAQLLASVAPGLEVRCEHASGTVCWLDSADWRLYRDGLVLEHIACKGTGELRLRALGGNFERAPVPMAQPPRSVDAVPGAYLRARLRELLRERALVPMARAHGDITGCALVDARGKQRVRLEFRRLRMLAGVNEGRGSRRAQLLTPTLQVDELTGYRRLANTVRRSLQRDTRFVAGRADPLVEAIHAVGREPLDYPISPTLTLEPGLPASEAVRAIHQRLLDALERNVDGVVADSDAEFLHDMRVAVRRARTLLAQVPGVLPERTCKRFRREFRWLGDVTGPARDGDVQLEEMIRVDAELGEADRASMAPLLVHLAEFRVDARARLLSALGSKRFHRLCRDWRKLLAAPLSPRTRLPNAARPVLALASERIARLNRRVLSAGAAITPASEPERLHELRKDGKKLRYLLEFFRSLYLEPGMSRALKTLKNLQDNLGEYQDLQVQRQLLQDFAPGAAGDTARLLVGIAARMEQRAVLVRGEFRPRFEAFRSEAARTLPGSRRGADVDGGSGPSQVGTGGTG